MSSDRLIGHYGPQSFSVLCPIYTSDAPRLTWLAHDLGFATNFERSTQPQLAMDFDHSKEGLTPPPFPISQQSL